MAKAAETKEKKTVKTPAVKKETAAKKPAGKAAAPKAKVAEKAVKAAKAPAAKVEKAAAKAKTIKSEYIIQSPMGGEITPEEIAKKVGSVDKVYIRVDENKAYWVKGEETGSVDLW